MSNLFDSDNFPTVEQEFLTIGDRWVWKHTDLGTDYSPSSYALSYNARSQGAGSIAISITTSESGDDYLVEVASAKTASYTAGAYSWYDYITRSSDSQRIQIDACDFVIQINLANDASDPKTHSEKMVDYLESYVESLA